MSSLDTRALEAVSDGSLGSAAFAARVHKLRAEGFDDNDYLTRQLVDDLFRETGTSYHLKQHILYALVCQVEPLETS